jgi:hypothetical protein
VVSSLDPSTAGYGALEVLMHESSHMWGVLRPTIFNAAGEQGVMVPPQLWHSVLFFTAGELTLRELKVHGITGYVDMATNLNLYTPMCGAGCKEKIAQHWMPHIDGTRSIPDALGGLVATFK